jgi:hypothetical protein
MLSSILPTRTDSERRRQANGRGLQQSRISVNSGFFLSQVVRVLQSLADFMKARPVAEWPGIHVAKSFYWQYEAQTQYGCIKASHLLFGLCKTLAKAWHWCASAPHLTHSIMKSRMTLSYRKIDTHLISITSAIYRIFRISKRRKIEKVIDSYW